MWKFNWNMTKDKWLLLLLAGGLLLIIAVPSGKGGSPGAAPAGDADQTQAMSALAGGRTYEEQLEKRVKSILKNVDGVGDVDVMIVLKSSEEKILRVDKSTSSSTTKEDDGGGTTREIANEELQESTILTGSGTGSTPIVEKELKPEIEGIIISAAGGGSPTVKAEITGAMEALFSIPPHKIRVLKRVE